MATNNNIDALNVNVLNVAKDEYTKQLNRILTPIILQGISSIYDDAVNILSEEEQNSGDDILKLVQFQRLLKDVPKWNQNIINNECGRIKNMCPWLNDLIVAVFVTHVKILTSVKINKGNKKFKFSMPNFDTYIHNVYIEAAKEFFFNPQLVYSYHGDSKKTLETNIIIEKSIDEAIRNLLPVQDILNTYISNNDDAEDEDEDEEDEDDGSDAEDDGSDAEDNGSDAEEAEELESDEREVSFDEKGKPIMNISEPDEGPPVLPAHEHDTVPDFNPEEAPPPSMDGDTAEREGETDNDSADDNDELGSDYKRVKPSLDE